MRSLIPFDWQISPPTPTIEESQDLNPRFAFTDTPGEATSAGLTQITSAAANLPAASRNDSIVSYMVGTVGGHPVVIGTELRAIRDTAGGIDADWTAAPLPAASSSKFVDTVNGGTLETGNLYRQLPTHVMNLPAITALNDGEFIEFTPDASDWSTLFGTGVDWTLNGGDTFASTVSNIQGKVVIRVVAHFDAGGSTWRVFAPSSTATPSSGGGFIVQPEIFDPAVTGTPHYGLPGWMPNEKNSSTVGLSAGEYLDWPFVSPVDITLTRVQASISAIGGTFIRWGVVEADDAGQPLPTGLRGQGTLPTAAVNQVDAVTSVPVKANTWYLLRLTPDGNPSLRGAHAIPPYALTTFGNQPWLLRTRRLSGGSSAPFVDPIAPNDVALSGPGQSRVLLGFQWTID